MLTQLTRVAALPTSGDSRRIKRSIVQPTRVTVHYLSFPAIKRTVPTPPAWLTDGAYGR